MSSNMTQQNFRKFCDDENLKKFRRLLCRIHIHMRNVHTIHTYANGLHDPVPCCHGSPTPPSRQLRGCRLCQPLSHSTSLYILLMYKCSKGGDFIDRILGWKEYSPLRCYFVMVSNKLDRIKDKTANVL